MWVFIFLSTFPFFSLFAANISGKVVDGSTHLPLANAKVEMMRGEEILVSLFTEFDGTYWISELEPKPYLIKVSMPNFQSFIQLIVPAINRTIHFEIALQYPSGKILGRVMNALTGQPVPHAMIDILKNGFLIDFAESDEEGSYLLPQVAPGDYELKVTAPLFQGTSQMITLLSRQSLEGYFALHPLGAIRGQVVHAFTNEPIARASVGLWQNNALINSANTDDQGCFYLNVLGHCQVVVQAPHFQDLEKGVQISSLEEVMTNFHLIPFAPTPPPRGSCEVIHKALAHCVNRIHSLKWKPSTDSSVTFYRIYRDQKLIAEVSANKDLVFKDPWRSKKDKVYSITAVNAFEQESSPLVIQLKE